MSEPNICESCKPSVWDAELVLIEHKRKGIPLQYFCNEQV